MHSRYGWRVLFTLLAVVPSLGASYSTGNFRVEAPTAEIAKQVGETAERLRQEQASAWIGKELPAWDKPCPIRVTITLGACRGCTSFAFDRGKVLSLSMAVEGPLDRLLSTVLPHEMAHAIVVNQVGQPLPRWADEGAAVLAEPAAERGRYQAISREISDTPGRAIPLRRLLPQRDYPADVTALHAQGYSLVSFLVKERGRPALLAFVAEGLRNNDWDAALKTHYGYRSADDLERAWLRNQKESTRAPASAMASGAVPAGEQIMKPVVPAAR
jgi:hypothetical protein